MSNISNAATDAAASAASTAGNADALLNDSTHRVDLAQMLMHCHTNGA